MNQITINFTPCSPALSYRVFYREVGDVSFIEWPDEFVSSPIVFSVVGDPGQAYEGYIVSVCEGDVTGPEVPWETTTPPGSGEEACCDPVIISADAETTVPDGSSSGSSSPGDFLRLVFNVNMAGESLSDWNVFLDTATWASGPFTSVVYSSGGTVVDLYGVESLQIPTASFNSNLNIIKVLDFADSVTLVQGAAFAGCENLNEVDLSVCEEVQAAGLFVCPALTTVNIPLVTEFSAQLFAGCTILNETGITSGVILNIGEDAFNASGIIVADFPSCLTCGLGAFRFCLNLTTINLPVCTAVGEELFRQNTVMTSIYMPVCSNFGTTPGDDDCFLDAVGMTFTLTIPTATATDGDIITAQANNSVTLILV